MAGNVVKELMLFFVGEIARRNVTPADYRGRHMKAAKTLLKEMSYSFDDVCGALISLRDGRFEHFGYEGSRDLPTRPLQGMEVLWCWGEPPLIERWIAPPEKPPIYSADYDKWVKQHGKRAIEQGVWDGIYLRQDPSACPWLVDIIGPDRYKESVNEWQTQEQTLQQSRQSSDTLPPM